MPPSLTNLAISTSWLSQDAISGAGLAQAVQEAGLSRLELEYRLTAPLLAELRRELRPRGLTVGSVHNYCPFPPELAGKLTPSGDLLNLAASDQDERRRAVEYTTRSLELASDLEAGAVVLHLGWLPKLQDRDITGQAALLGRLTPELAAARRLRQGGLAPGAGRRELLPGAPRGAGRASGGEAGPRKPLPSLPGPHPGGDRGPAGALRRGAPGLLARHRELAGLNPASAYLERLGDHLLGCHLHDIKGVENHLLPGTGDLDWPALAPLLAKAPHQVIELRPGPSPREVGESARLLASVLATAHGEKRQDQ